MAGIVVALLTTAGLVFGFTSPASAAVYGGYVAGPASAPGASSGNPMGWYSVDTANNSLRIAVWANYLPAGKCLSLWVDVKRGSGIGEGDHYDIRVLRNCRSYGDYDTGTKFENVDVTDINKAFFCYGSTTSHGDCRIFYMKEGSLAQVSPILGANQMCSRTWGLTANNDPIYWAGGDSKSCTS